MKLSRLHDCGVNTGYVALFLHVKILNFIGSKIRIASELQIYAYNILCCKFKAEFLWRNFMNG